GPVGADRAAEVVRRDAERAVEPDAELVRADVLTVLDDVGVEERLLVDARGDVEATGRGRERPAAARLGTVERLTRDRDVVQRDARRRRRARIAFLRRVRPVLEPEQDGLAGVG